MDDFLSQDEIDALLNAAGGDAAEEPAKKAASSPAEASPHAAPAQKNDTSGDSNAILSQDDLDALLNLDEEPSPADGAKETGDSTGAISQDEIDDLLNSIPDMKPESIPDGKGSPTPAVSTQPAGKPIENSDDLLSQDELDELLGLSGASGEAPTSAVSSPAKKPVSSSPGTENSSGQQKTPEKKIEIPAAKASIEPPPPEKESESDSILSQDDIDALINSFSPTREKPTSKVNVPASEPRPTAKITMASQVMDNAAKAFAAAPVAPKRFKLYDFRRPEKLSKDQVRKIKTYFESLPRHLSNYFALLLRRRVDVSLVDIDQKNYGDMFKSSSTPIIYGIFSLGPAFPSGVIEFSTHVFYCMLEKMMGGSGNSIVPVHPLTEFERFLITDLFMNVLRYYQDLFNKLTHVEPQIDLVDTDGLMIPKTLSEEEVLVRNIYEVRIGGISGYMIISVPYNFIGPLFSRYNNPKETVREASDISEALAGKSYGKLAVPVSVELDKVRIRTADAVNLSPGQIIHLEHPLNKDVSIKVNGKLKYFGKAGMRGNKIAVSITSTIEEEAL